MATISRALNNSKHAVNEETGQRILSLAKELGYRPNLVARSLKAKRSHAIGIIIDDIASPVGLVITRGIQDYLKEYGYFGVLINGDWNPKVEIQAVHHNSVGVDEHHGARLAIQHLAKLGHRRIACINGPRGWYAADI